MESNEYELMSSVEDVHWWWRARREILADTIRAHLPDFGVLRSVAEVGCGTGGNLPMLAEFGEVLGAELEPSAVVRAHEKHGGRFEVIQHSIPEPLPRPVHLLGMFDVIEHVADDAGALRWAAQQVVPGGLVLITVPAFDFLWTRHDEAAHHFRRYSPASLRAIVPPELQVLHLTCFNVLLFPVVTIIRTALRLIPRAVQPHKTHMGLPPEPLNELLYRLFRIERRLAPHRRFPLGVSVLAVLRRQDAQG
jgi:SAM-dependent methyltransferase